MRFIFLIKSEVVMWKFLVVCGVFVYNVLCVIIFNKRGVL